MRPPPDMPRCSGVYWFDPRLAYCRRGSVSSLTRNRRCAFSGLFRCREKQGTALTNGRGAFCGSAYVARNPSVKGVPTGLPICPYASPRPKVLTFSVPSSPILAPFSGASSGASSLSKNVASGLTQSHSPSRGKCTSLLAKRLLERIRGLSGRRSQNPAGLGP